MSPTLLFTKCLGICQHGLIRLGLLSPCGQTVPHQPHLPGRDDRRPVCALVPTARCVTLLAPLGFSGGGPCSWELPDCCLLHGRWLGVGRGVCWDGALCLVRGSILHLAPWPRVHPFQPELWEVPLGSGATVMDMWVCVRQPQGP